LQHLLAIFAHQYNELKELYLSIVCLFSHVRAVRNFRELSSLVPRKNLGKPWERGWKLSSRYFTASEITSLLCSIKLLCKYVKSAVNKNGYYAISCITKFSVRQIFKKKQRSAKKGMILRHLSRSLRFVRPDKTSQPMKMKIENNRDTQNKTIVA